MHMEERIVGLSCDTTFSLELNRCLAWMVITLAEKGKKKRNNLGPRSNQMLPTKQPFSGHKKKAPNKE